MAWAKPASTNQAPDNNGRVPKAMVFTDFFTSL